MENVKNCSVIIELVGECFYKFKYIKVCCYIVFSVIDGKKYCVYVKFKGQGKSSLLLEGWMFLGCVDFILFFKFDVSVMFFFVCDVESGVMIGFGVFGFVEIFVG